jgi:hypothetical protein
MTLLPVHIHIHEIGESPARDRAAILLGQLTILRRRAECGIPVTVDSLVRARRPVSRRETRWGGLRADVQVGRPPAPRASQ